jgi:transposase
MTPRAGKEFRRSAQAEDLAVTHRHAAGIDVHSREHFVAVTAEDVPAGFVNRDEKLPAGVRKFGTNTGDLEAIASALYGNWRSELLFALKQTLHLYEFYQKQLRECEGQIEACLLALKDKSDGRPLPPSLRKRKPEKNQVRFGARVLLFRMSGVDLTQIEGISETTALVILSELGTDLSAFAHEKNFVSWLGLCPQHRGSGGKIFKRRIRRGANRVARALRMAAQGCHHAKNALGAFYRRIQARAGGSKAIVATARKIAERVYRLLKYGQEYVRQSEQGYEAAYQQRLMKSLAKKAASLGYKLVPETMAG